VDESSEIQSGEQVVKPAGLVGIRVMEMVVRPDDRGFFAELFRKDWVDFFSEDIVQANVSLSYPGIVRAWHRHERGQTDYFAVLEGAVKICAYDQGSRSLVEIVASEQRRTVVRVPGHYLHGTMTLGTTSSLIVYLTTKLYDASNPDEERLPWNDASVKPADINGRIDDPRVGRPWDWFYPRCR
jgi:dTDP-4-dehydrorhamnose 3,5-epimerase